MQPTEETNQIHAVLMIEILLEWLRWTEPGPESVNAIGGFIVHTWVRLYAEHRERRALH